MVDGGFAFVEEVPYTTLEECKKSERFKTFDPSTRVKTALYFLGGKEESNYVDEETLEKSLWEVNSIKDIYRGLLISKIRDEIDSGMCDKGLSFKLTIVGRAEVESALCKVSGD